MEPLWVFDWNDDGELSFDDLVDPRNAVQRVTDDRAAVDAYFVAKMELHKARMRVYDSLRDPTEAETAVYVERCERKWDE